MRSRGNQQRSRQQLPTATSEVEEPTSGADELTDGEAWTTRLAPDLQSVGQARTKLAEVANAWGCPGHLVDDARVVLSELMSNAVLHARTEVRVVISRRGKGLRLEVHDASSAPLLPPLDVAEGAASLLDEPQQLNVITRFPPAATGRGLSIVSALSSAWGWYPEGSGGKIVWAELGTVEAAEERAGRSFSTRYAYAMRPVRIVAAPLRLVKESEDHFDDLFRELQMASLGGPGDRGGAEGAAGTDAREVVARLAPLAEHVKSRLASMREPVRRAIWEATRSGDRLIDLNLLADAGMPSVFEMFAELLREAALGARSGFLLTEPPSREVAAWRRWLRLEMESQIAGRPPRACPFPVHPVSEEEHGRVGSERLDAARNEAVSQLRSLFATETGPPSGETTLPVRRGYPDDELILHALGRITGYLGARRVVLCLLAEDNMTVSFGASLGFRNEVADYWQATSLSADLPASEVIRTGRIALFRTFAELDERYPIFLSTPSENDPALACVPLLPAEGPAVGCLALGFPKARDFSGREVSFLTQLAGEFAHYLTAWRNWDAERRSSARHQPLEDALRDIGSAQSTDAVVAALVAATASLVAEGVTVHLLENGALRYMTTYHRDPKWAADAAELVHRRQASGDDMIAECARTGQPSVLQLFPEEAIVARAADDDEAARLRRLAIGSVAAFPICDNARLVGVLSFSKGVGRFISDEDLSVVQRLADKAGSTLAQLGF